MNIYRLKRCDDPNSFLKVGMLFFIMDDMAYPLGATNGVGLDLEFLGLNDQEQFDRYFEYAEDRAVKDIPALAKYKARIEEEIEELESQLCYKRAILKKVERRCGE